MIKQLLIFIKKRILIIIFLSFYFGFCLLTYKDYGLTMDEFFVYTRGRYFYTKVKGNDAKLQKGFVVDEQGRNQDILYNNSSYPALLYAINDSESYEIYHLLNLIIACSIFYVFYEILLYLFNKSIYAITGPIFLFFTPRFLGHIPANPKDVPFAIAYILSLFAIFFSRKWNEKIGILLTGTLIGLTASLRFIGLSLISIYGMFELFLMWDNTKKIVFKDIFNIILRILLIFLIAFLMLMINMPYVAADPFNHFIELLKVNSKYPWYGNILYFGKLISVDNRPVSYLLSWLGITTPVFILILFISSLLTKSTGEKRILKFLLLISLVFQFILYVVLKPVVYNGLRHYLFFIPQIVLLSSITFIEFMQQSNKKILILGLCSLNIIFILISYMNLHPYEYTHFNALIGGIKVAKGKMEIDYWGASDKEAFKKLRTYIQREKKPVNVFTCSKSYSTNYYLPEVNHIKSDIHMKKADYIVCYDGVLNEKIEKELKVDLIGTVSRQDINLNYIYKVNNED